MISLREWEPFQWGGEWVAHGELREKPTREMSKK
jgi:hypothetical protein